MDECREASNTECAAQADSSGTNVAQIVFSESGPVGLAGSPAMPAFGDSYSNQEIADVTNYVTARFGTKGSSLSEKDVADLRRQAVQ